MKIAAFKFNLTPEQAAIVDACWHDHGGAPGLVLLCQPLFRKRGRIEVKGALFDRESGERISAALEKETTL